MGATLLTFLLQLIPFTVRFPARKTGKGTGDAQDEACLPAAAEDDAACGALSSVTSGK
jgi:hypothetical protein